MASPRRSEREESHTETDSTTVTQSDQPATDDTATGPTTAGDTTTTPVEATDETVTTGDTTRGNGDDDESPFYCPGCGRRFEYQQQCTGRPDSPHPPIEVVSTDELRGDDHTAAPNTDR
jgi:hypothetical protein